MVIGMSYKEKFEEGQWLTLQMSIAWFFEYISSADGKIDKKEFQSLDKILSKPDAFSSDLTKEVIASIESSGTLLALKGQDPRALKEGLDDFAKIIDYTLSKSEAFDVKKDYIAMGMFIASSSGSFFGGKVCHDELDSLAELGVVINIHVKQLLETSMIESIVEKLSA